MENSRTPETGPGRKHTSHSLHLALHQKLLRSLRSIIGGGGHDETISQNLLTPS